MSIRRLKTNKPVGEKMRIFTTYLRVSRLKMTAVLGWHFPSAYFANTLVKTAGERSVPFRKLTWIPAKINSNEMATALSLHGQKKTPNKTKQKWWEGRAGQALAVHFCLLVLNKTSEVADYFHQAQVSVGPNFSSLLLFKLSYSTTCCASDFVFPPFFLYDAVKL